MTHSGYILAAYLVSAVVLLGAVATVVGDLVTQRRRLRRLEEEGLRRRSEVPR